MPPGYRRPLLAAAAIVMLIATASSLITQSAWAKNLPMGHPSLILQLRAGDDARFDYFVVDEDSFKALKDDIGTKLYSIIETIVLPEIKKQFDEREEIYSNGYIEYVSVNYQADESRLEILIAKQPEDYGCDTEGCAARIVNVGIPAELMLSQVRQIGMFIAVYETPSQQLVDKIQTKALSEARILLSEASGIIEEKKEELLADRTPVESFYLRQYEDISRVTILFSPNEPGGPAKEPIDVVDTSNSYYKRTSSSSAIDNKFEIWPSDSVTSTAWNTYIRGTICPSPVTDAGREEQYDPDTHALIDLGSGVEITYYAISPEGIEKPIENSLYYPTTDFCSEAPGAYLTPDVEGNWTVYGTARWISEGVVQEIQSNEVKVLVKPAMYKSTNSETLALDANNYPLLKLLDWSSDGKSILVAYDNTYNASIGIDPRTTPSIETGVLGIMDPEGNEIRIIDLPAHFRYFNDARFSPSSDEILLITGSTYEFENQATVFKYDLGSGKLVPLPEISGYAVWVRDKDGDGSDDIVFGKEIRDSSHQDRLEKFEIWLASSDGTVEKLYQQSVDDEAGFQIDDSSTDGNKMLITVYKQSEFPVNVNDLAIFDLQSRKLATILSSTNTEFTRFAPFDGLVLYNIGSGYKTPDGPSYIMTADGSYHEQLYLGGRPGTVDSPETLVVSPDGRFVLSVFEEWGSGRLYLTKTQLAQSIPEFGSLAALISALAVMAGLVGLAAIKRNRFSL